MKAEGIWNCDVLGGKYGANDKDVPTVQISVRITDGPSAGQLANYEDIVDARSAKYVRYSVEAVGGNPLKLEKLEEDIAAWIAKTGGKSTVEIKHLEIKNGKKAGTTWDKVQGIGRGAPRPLRSVSSEAARDAADAMRAVMGDEPDYGDVPPPSDNDFGTTKIGQRSEDDLPF